MQQGFYCVLVCICEFHVTVQEEIEKMEKKMEMGGEAGPKQSLHTLLQRQNKFLDSCRETKVSDLLLAKGRKYYLRLQKWM